MRGMDLIISDANGIYIPKIFADGYEWEGISEEDRTILRSGPEHEHYWEAWDDVIASARFTDQYGYTWQLYQDGDLFAACYALIDEGREEQFYD
jgi:hypothetical protein